MKTPLQAALLLLLGTALSAQADPPEMPCPAPGASDAAGAFHEAAAAQPKLLEISARVDGSGRIIFTPKKVRYEHKHWQRPDHVLFDGEPWTRLDETPAAWRDYGRRLDLTKARIVERQGRDAIALEHTPDGFDLYLCDSPNGAADYRVTIAVPRRK